MPANWEDMNLYDRRGFLRGEGELGVKTLGTVSRDHVCIMELFGKNASSLKKFDSYEISGIMRKMGSGRSILQIRAR